jgi:hypothetical protein
MSGNVTPIIPLAGTGGATPIIPTTIPLQVAATPIIPTTIPLQVAAGTAATTVQCPRVGGLIANGSTSMTAWTGGEPSNPQRTGTKNLRASTPFCKRPEDDGLSLKVYQTMTSPKVGQKTFTRSSNLPQFENRVLAHAKMSGLDGILWASPSYNNTQMINIVTHHSGITVEDVRAYFQGANIDDYDVENMDALSVWIFASVDDDLSHSLNQRMKDGDSGPVVFMLLVMEIRSETYRYFEERKKEMKHLHLKDFPGENITEFFGKYDDLARELTIAKEYEDQFIVDLILTLSKCGEEAFRTTFLGKTSGAMKFVREVKFLDEKAKETRPDAGDYKFSTISLEACALYRDLADCNSWSPGQTGGDQQHAPEINLADLEKDVLIQNLQKKLQMKDKPDTQGGGKKSKWKHLAPRTDEKHSKQMLSNGESVWWHWCKVCNRWTRSHTTERHGIYDDEGKSATESGKETPKDSKRDGQGKEANLSLVSNVGNEADGAWFQQPGAFY